MAMDRTSHELQIFKGSVIGQSHKVEALLGEGGFGLVTKCRNTKMDKLEAIKVNKNHPQIARQARNEIKILKRLQCLDADTCNIVTWNGFFFDKNRTCLSFELLDQSLYDYMEDKHFQVLPMTDVRPILHQLATALSHLGSLGIVHADVKPENVMVVDRQRKPLKVKLIDFGLACPVSAVEPGLCVQTICYRAPEVMLQTPFNEAIDMWSLGLVAAELATGFQLYPGETDYDMLSFIIQTQGQPADYVLDCGMGTDYFFSKQENKQQHWRFLTPEEFEKDTGVYATDRRQVKLNSLDDLEQLMDTNRAHQRQKHLLVDLIKRLLQLDADLRPKALEVLQHPYFAHSLPQSSPVDTCIEIIDMEEVSRRASRQATGRENIRHRVKSTPAPPAAEPEDGEESRAEKKDGWFGRCCRWIAGAFDFYSSYMDG